MALKPCDPAEAGDVWLRVITNKKYWRDDGTIHNGAFAGKGGFAHVDDHPWTHDLSGRLLSLVKDLGKDCINFCGERYAGVMFQNVETLRSENSGWPTDVIYTPLERDPAHADFVAFNVGNDLDYFQVRDWLQDIIQYVKPEKVEAVEVALRAAAAK